MNKRSIWYLAVAETLVWAGMFYSFPALILRWETDPGWSKTQLSATFTTALIVSAFSAPLAGHLIDRGYGRMVLAGSALIGGLMVAALCVIEQFGFFFIAWLVLGFAMAGCLYEPCFAFVTRTRGLEAKRSITLITLVAGFAGTVSFPTANIVAEWGGWRSSMAVFSILILLVSVPLFLMGTVSEKVYKKSIGTDRESPSRKGVKKALTRPAFWLLATGFTSIAVGHGLLITHLLPLLAERSIPIGIAVTAASLIGPMQVARRVVMMAAERRFYSSSAVSLP